MRSPRAWHRGAWLVLGLAAPRLLWAQESDPASNEVEKAGSGPGRDGSDRAGAAGAPENNLDPEGGNRKAARERFKEGTEQFGDEAWDQALASFEASHELVPSPNSSLMAARCLSALGRHGEAMATFARAIEEAGDVEKYQQTREVAESERDALRGGLARVTVRVLEAPPGTRVTIAGELTPLEADVARRWVEAGRVNITVDRPGREPLLRSLEASKGGELVIELTPGDREPTEPDEGGFHPGEWLPPAAIAAGGVGLVGMGLFIGFGLSNQSTYRDLEETCAPRCGAAFDDEIAAGERDGLIANVSLGVGAVGLVAAGVLGTLYLTQDAELAVGPNQARLRVRF